MATSDDTGGETNANIHWLKPNQVEAMRDTAHEGRHGPRDDALVTLLYDTGLRRGELAQVDRDMLDLDAEQLRIPPGIQKDYPNDNTPNAATFALDQSDSLRTVRTLRAYLATRDDSSAALVPSRKSDRMTGKEINDVVKRLADRASVRPFAYAAAATRPTSAPTRSATASPGACFERRTGTRSTTSGTGYGTPRY